jgi:hypothetical protein
MYRREETALFALDDPFDGHTPIQLAVRKSQRENIRSTQQVLQPVVKTSQQAHLAQDAANTDSAGATFVVNWSTNVVNHARPHTNALDVSFLVFNKHKVLLPLEDH